MADQNSVLVTGGTGSFGQTVVKKLLGDGCPEIRILSRDEEKQDTLRTQLNDRRVRYFIGDVRDIGSVDRATAGVDCVFHAAALKQVPSCEFFPMEAIKTNVVGSENVIRSAIKNGVRSLVCLSTDKAVFPVNAMGLSKALMEKSAQAAAREIGVSSKTTISTVRYGNVMYSRGSVIPLFIKQIMNATPITITEPTMTRFLMPLRDSVELVSFAFDNARQGDTFIRKAPSATIADLVSALKNLFEVPEHPVNIIGWRHAEKLYETLASSQELSAADDLGDYYRIKMDERDLNYHAYFSEGQEETVQYEDFHSHNCRRLQVDEISDLLMSLPEVSERVEVWKSRKN